MIKAVLFDVDGVLLDTLESNTRAYNHDLVRLGGKAMTVDEYRKFYHLLARKMFKKFFPENSVYFHRIERENIDGILFT